MDFYDDNGNIREELLDTEAERLAKSFVTFYQHPRTNKTLPGRDSLSAAQLRRFFGEFRQLEKRVNAQGFKKVLPLIKMVKSRAAYAANPGNRKIPEKFKQFLVENVDRINTHDDFKAFMLHFEAIVGFFYGIEGVSNN